MPRSWQRSIIVEIICSYFVFLFGIHHFEIGVKPRECYSTPDRSLRMNFKGFTHTPLKKNTFFLVLTTLAKDSRHGRNVFRASSGQNHPLGSREAQREFYLKYEGFSPLFLFPSAILKSGLNQYRNLI